MTIERSDTHVADLLRNQIDKDLSRIGVLFRVFGRAKSSESISVKLSKKDYGIEETSSKMQDLFGIRIALYFPDDSELAQNTLRARYVWDEASSTIDLPTDATFGPTRCNLIFRLPDDLAQLSLTLKQEKRIDKTFEVQFRTVFSEGWHEVEHDLRYKCKDDWLNHSDLNRAMNGFIATLETCDWAMVKLFEELAWRHYKKGEWLAMLRTKFRVRFQDTTISEEILKILDSDNDIAKSLFRVDRSDLMAKIFETKIDLPITPSNLVFIANHYFINSSEISNITPSPVSEELG